MEAKYEGPLGIKEAAKYLGKSVIDTADLLNEGKISSTKQKINDKTVIVIDSVSLRKYKSDLESRLQKSQEPHLQEKIVIPSQEELEKMKRYDYLSNELKLDNWEIDSLGEAGQREAVFRRKEIADILYGKRELADLLIKQSKATKDPLYKADKNYFNKYAGMLRTVITDLNDWKNTLERVKKSPFFFASYDELRKVYASLEKEKKPAAKPVVSASGYKSPYADQALAASLEQACSRIGCSFEAFDKIMRIIAKGGFPAKGINRKVSHLLPHGSASPLEILDSLSGMKVIRTGGRSGKSETYYSVNNNSGEISNPYFRQYVGNINALRHRRSG